MAKTERQTAVAAACKAYNALCRKALSTGQWPSGLDSAWQRLRSDYDGLSDSERGAWAGFADFCACQNVTPRWEMCAEFR